MTSYRVALLLALLFVQVACLPTAVPTKEEEDGEAEDKTNPFNARIGIIGAGPSGLFAARELQRLGYTRVKVLEKSDVGVANITNSAHLDGKVFDLTTRFIPPTTFTGPGAPANFQEMVNEYGLNTVPSQPLSFLDTTTPALYPGPHIFAAFTGPQIVGDLVWGFELLKTVYNLGSITACHAAGIASPGESFTAFSQRVNKPAFTAFSAYLQDLFLGGRAAFQPACLVLQVRARFMSSDIAAVLKQAGLTSATPGISAELGSLLDLSFTQLSRTVFVDGYQNFFDTLVDQEFLDVNLGEAVVSLVKKNNGKFQARTTKRTHNFDKVIIATRPWDALSFLEDDAPIRPLYAQSFYDPVFVLFGRTTGTLPLVGDPYATVLYPQAFQAGTPSLAYSGVPLAAAKFYGDADATVAIGFASPSQTTTDLQNINSATLAASGVTVTDWVDSQVYPYVADVHVADSANGFFENIEALQGVDDYYYVSEAMAGSGVPSVLDYVQQIISQHF